jgi:hypothetical protein
MTIYRDDLERVYALIEKPEAWTQGAFARDADGNATYSRGENAVCWCLRGATYKLWGGLDDFCGALQVKHVADFNDSHTHAKVLQLLKDAIERAPVRPADDRARVV